MAPTVATTGTTAITRPPRPSPAHIGHHMGYRYGATTDITVPACYDEALPYVFNNNHSVDLSLYPRHGFLYI
jgi:hypothetical protein